MYVRRRMPMRPLEAPMAGAVARFCRSCMFGPGRIFSSLTLLVTGGIRKFLHRSKPEEDEPGENAKPGRAVCDRKLANPAPFRDASRTADGVALPRDSPGSSHFHYPRLRGV